MTRTHVVTFGEIMGRLAAPGHLRLRQVLPGSLEFTFGGAEANVAVSVSRLGLPTRLVTALPDGPLNDACRDELRGYGVDISGIQTTESGRFGLYFVERGANQRPSSVTYDRAGSAIATAPASLYPWKDLFADARWFHTTGITPALSASAAEAVLAAVKAAHAQGITVSMDLNFRKKLWRWESGTDPKDLAGRVMREILPFVDVLIGNEGDAEDVLGIRAGGSEVESGKLEIEKYPEVAARIAEQFPNLKKVAITLRESISADHNNWGAMLYDIATTSHVFAPMREGQYRPYQIRDIVDRVGGGDAFGAGLIRILADDTDHDDEYALSFAVAASCLAHSTSGDFNLATFDEVTALVGGSASGRVIR